MSKLKFYKSGALLMLLLNLALVTFLLMGKPPKRMNGMSFQKKAVEILQLDDKQERLFIESAQKHSEQMIAMDGQQSELLKAYFDNLIVEKESSARDNQLQQIQQMELGKIQATYEHFEEVKSLLREEQKSGFEEFIKKVQEIILLKQNRK